MKQPINPVAAAAVIAALVLVVGFFIWRGANPPPQAAGPGSAQGSMPPNVAAEFQRRLGGVKPNVPPVAPGAR